MRALKLNTIFLVLTSFLFAGHVYSQGSGRSYGRSKSDWYGGKFRGTPLYKWNGFYRRTGLHFTAGATYTLTRINPREETYTSSFGDTTFTQSFLPKGRLGYYVKFGAAHIFKFKRKIFQYIDYGIGVKHFGGYERYEASAMVTDTTGSSSVSIPLEGEGKFDNGYVFLDFNINNVIQISANNWIQNSLGFNLDYKIYGGERAYYTGFQPAQTQPFQEDLKFDIHYKLGLGIKLVNGMYLIPSVETPIFTAYGWDGGNPSIRWFNSRYQPLIVSLTFAFLFRKNPEDCPPMFENDGMKKSDSYQNSGGR